MWNGASSVQPSVPGRRVQRRGGIQHRVQRPSDSSPATASGSSARTPRSRTTTMPPPSSASRPTAAGHVAVVDADARRRCGRRGRRWRRSRRGAGRTRATKPRPTRPVPRWRSTTAILARSRSGSATAAGRGRSAAPPATRSRSGRARSRSRVPATRPTGCAGRSEEIGCTRTVPSPTRARRSARAPAAGGRPSAPARAGTAPGRAAPAGRRGARRDRAAIAQAVPLGGVSGGDGERVGGSTPAVDRARAPSS